MKNLNEGEYEMKRHFAIRLDYVLIGLLIIACSGLQIVLFWEQYATVWGDEAYTMLLLRMPFDEMWKEILVDVHPPLYYLILRLVSSVFGYHFRVFKFLSALPLILMHIWVSFLAFRNSSSKHVAPLLAVFIFATTFTETFLYLSTELRMYSWATFFVTMSGIYAYRVFKRFKISDELIFTILSLCAALCHYYALFMEVYIYVVLFAVILLKKREHWKNLILLAACVVLGYSWWLPFALRQFFDVKGNYWIRISYIELTEFFSHLIGINVTLEFIFVCFLIFETISFIKSSTNKDSAAVQDSVFGIASVGLVYFVFLAGILLTVLIRPLMQERYIQPAMGLFWLGIVILIGNLPKHKRIYTCLLAGVLLSVFVTAYPACLTEEYETGTKEAVQFAQSVIKDNDCLASDIGHLNWTVLKYYFPNNRVEDIDDIDFNTEDGTVWYFENRGDEQNKDYIKEAGFNIEEVYSGKIDTRYKFNLYKISKE